MLVVQVAVLNKSQLVELYLRNCMSLGLIIREKMLSGKHQTWTVMFEALIWVLEYLMTDANHQSLRLQSWAWYDLKKKKKKKYQK